MNALFGRSRSKHQKVAGSLKDRIGNPTPIDPININGTFIDLRLSPQGGARSADAPLQLPPFLASKQVAQLRVEDRNNVEPVNDADGQNQTQSKPPTRPRRADSDSTVACFEVDDPVSAAPDTEARSLPSSSVLEQEGFVEGNQM